MEETHAPIGAQQNLAVRKGTRDNAANGGPEAPLSAFVPRA